MFLVYNWKTPCMFFLVTASYRKLIKEDYLDKNPNAGDKRREVSFAYHTQRRGDFKAEMESKVFRKNVGEMVA